MPSAPSMSRAAKPTAVKRLTSSDMGQALA
jgi:hypothetical protein